MRKGKPPFIQDLEYLKAVSSPTDPKPELKVYKVPCDAQVNIKN